jgi:ribosomal protein L7Ae-like RNA K-turn-binding protein
VSDALVALLGLGARARSLVIGVAGVRARLQRGRLAAVVIAADASERTREKVERLAVARGVPVLVGPAAARLGARLGRPAVQTVGVSDRALARGLMRLSEELRGDTDS